jgi:hypothetical protein
MKQDSGFELTINVPTEEAAKIFLPKSRSGQEVHNSTMINEVQGKYMIAFSPFLVYNDFHNQVTGGVADVVTPLDREPHKLG